MLSNDLENQRTAPPRTVPSVDPLLRLQEETQPSKRDSGLRAPTHPDEIRITGLTVLCPECGARRDWMVICDRAEIGIRCRCTHQWIERELTRADYFAMIDEGIGQDYPSLEAAAQAVGYDGTLPGTYLNEPRPE